MLLPDVNILLYAFRQDSADHARYRRWLESHLSGDEPIGISELALSGAVRIMTNHRAYSQPSTPEAAFALCEEVLASPAAVPLRPGPRHWSIFAGLCRSTRVRANDVADAYHAALAVENGAILVTNDSGFRRFPGLRVEPPQLS